MTESSLRLRFDAAKTPQQTTNKSKHPPPFSLRLTPEQRERLEREAAGQALGVYIRHRLFADAPRRRASGITIEDRQALSQVLGQLGRSTLASNVNQLAKAVNMGTLPVTPQTEEEIRKACFDIAVMRMTLLKALGKKSG